MGYVYMGNVDGLVGNLLSSSIIEESLLISSCNSKVGNVDSLLLSSFGIIDGSKSDLVISSCISGGDVGNIVLSSIVNKNDDDDGGFMGVRRLVGSEREVVEVRGFIEYGRSVGLVVSGEYIDFRVEDERDDYKDYLFSKEGSYGIRMVSAVDINDKEMLGLYERWLGVYNKGKLITQRWYICGKCGRVIKNLRAFRFHEKYCGREKKVKEKKDPYFIKGVNRNKGRVKKDCICKYCGINFGDIEMTSIDWIRYMNHVGYLCEKNEKRVTRVRRKVRKMLRARYRRKRIMSWRMKISNKRRGLKNMEKYLEYLLEQERKRKEKRLLRKLEKQRLLGLLSGGNSDVNMGNNKRVENRKDNNNNVDGLEFSMGV